MERKLTEIICDDYCKYPELYKGKTNELGEEELYLPDGPCYNCKVFEKIFKIVNQMSEF